MELEEVPRMEWITCEGGGFRDGLKFKFEGYDICKVDDGNVWSMRIGDNVSYWATAHQAKWAAEIDLFCSRIKHNLLDRVSNACSQQKEIVEPLRWWKEKDLLYSKRDSISFRIARNHKNQIEWTCYELYRECYSDVLSKERLIYSPPCGYTDSMEQAKQDCYQWLCIYVKKLNGHNE